MISKKVSPETQKMTKVPSLKKRLSNLDLDRPITLLKITPDVTTV